MPSWWAPQAPGTTALISNLGGRNPRGIGEPVDGVFTQPKVGSHFGEPPPMMTVVADQAIRGCNPDRSSLPKIQEEDVSICQAAIVQ